MSECAAANRDQGYPQSIGVMSVREPLDVVAGYELELLEFVFMPSTAIYDLDLVLSLSVSKPNVAPGLSLPLVVRESQQAFERAVVDVAGTAELRIVGIARSGRTADQTGTNKRARPTRHRGRPRR